MLIAHSILSAVLLYKKDLSIFSHCVIKLSFCPIKKFMDRLTFIHIMDHKILMSLSRIKDIPYISGVKQELEENEPGTKK